MIRATLLAAAAMLLAAPAFAEGGDVFTNNPNELPQFIAHGAPNPAEWAGPFFHSQISPQPREARLAQREAAPARARN